MSIQKYSRGRWLLLGFLLANVLVSVSAEETIDVAGRGVSFGPRASYFKSKDADEGTWSGGAQMRIKPFQALGFEGSIDYRREKYGDTRVDVYPVQASLLAYILPIKPVNIFLLGGAGWYFTHVDRPSPFADSTDNRFGLHAGAGLEFNLNDAWSLDGTYRYVWLEKFTSKDTILFDKEFSDSGSQVTVGLNYHF